MNYSDNLIKYFVLLASIFVIGGCTQNHDFFMCYLTPNDAEYISLLKELEANEVGNEILDSGLSLRKIIMAMFPFSLAGAFIMGIMKKGWGFFVLLLLVGLAFFGFEALSKGISADLQGEKIKTEINVERINKKLSELKSPEADIVKLCKYPDGSEIIQNGKSYYKMNPNQVK